MHVVLGATGHVGSVVALRLLERGEAVTAVARDPAKAEGLEQRGARIAVLDLRDVDRLRDVFRDARRAFLLSPPAPPSTDTDREERANVAAILRALEGSGLEAVVAQSTYGARAGERCGDLTVLHEFERGLHAQPIPAVIMRAAYMMSNWDAQIDAARNGEIHTMIPPDEMLPMVAPCDLGAFAADRLAEEPFRPGLYHVEGPELYRPRDVGAALSRSLGAEVKVSAVPQEAWVETFRAIGFSDAAATSFAAMTKVTVEEPFLPEDAVRGPTSLQDYFDARVRSAA